MRRILLLFLALFAVPALPRALHARDIVIRNYRTEVLVNRDGTADVTEILRLHFEGGWNGVYRDISLAHQTAQGMRERLDVDHVTVQDDRGNDLEFWNESPSGMVHRVKIRVPGADQPEADGTVIIRYRVKNAIRFFFDGDEGGQHDELYWNATGNEWEFPIEQASAVFIVPVGALPTAAYAYTGAAGSNASDATVRIVGRTVTATATRPLAAREGLTLAVSWPAGVLPRPSLDEIRARQAAKRWPFGLPLVAFVLMFMRWRKVGRDPRELPVTVQYAPPDEMTPAELGTLVDNSADLKDITSTLVDLAVRGFVGIEEVQDKHLFGLLASRDWRFHRLTDSTTGLQAHERYFMDALFTGADDGPAWGVVKEAAERAATVGGAESASEFVDAAPATQPCIRLSELKNRFYTSLPGIRQAIFDRLIERGYYLKRPDEVKGLWIAVGIVIAVLSGIAAGTLGDNGWAWFDTTAVAVGGIGSGIIVALFGLAMASRTERGARAREAALGFKEFLSKVESDRYRRMVTSPEMFERFLPHAMAFGVEARWAKAFEDIYREPPGWYAGSGYHSFSASHFSSQMSTLGSSAASTMSSSPSGSSGGGSSGGGSGGGGGGGW